MLCEGIFLLLILYILFFVLVGFWWLFWRIDLLLIGVEDVLWVCIFCFKVVVEDFFLFKLEVRVIGWWRMCEEFNGFFFWFDSLGVLVGFRGWVMGVILLFCGFFNLVWVFFIIGGFKLLVLIFGGFVMVLLILEGLIGVGDVVRVFFLFFIRFSCSGMKGLIECVVGVVVLWGFIFVKDSFLFLKFLLVLRDIFGIEVFLWIWGFWGVIVIMCFGFMEFLVEVKDLIELLLFEEFLEGIDVFIVLFLIFVDFLIENEGFERLFFWLKDLLGDNEGFGFNLE